MVQRDKSPSQLEKTIGSIQVGANANRKVSRPDSHDKSHSNTLQLQVPADQEELSGLERIVKTARGPRDQELFIPVHGFVWLLPEELAVLNHPTVQRLGYIHQLGQSHLIYRGATHMRLEHALGSVAVVAKIVRAIGKNFSNRDIEAEGKARFEWGQPLTNCEEAFVRLAGLLHDVGHLPAGHTLEDELGILPPHDSLDRLNRVLHKQSWYGVTCESLADLIDREYMKHLDGEAISPSTLLLAIVARDTPMPVTNTIRLGICRDIVGNTICADLLDYLQRDWYHIGKLKYFETRLFQYMEIRRDQGGHEVFVISLGSFPNLRTDAISAMLELLESRFSLCESVLFHPTKCSFAACLERGLLELRSNPTALDKVAAFDPNHIQELLLEMSDVEMLKYFLATARNAGIPAAVRIFEALLLRQVYKEFDTEFGDGINQTVKVEIQAIYANSAKGPDNRLVALRGLETDFDLPPGSIAMYCPATGMNAKIPEVKVCIGNSITMLHELEEHADSSPARVSAGHVKAMLDRFAGLWRVHFFVERTIYEHLSERLRSALLQGIRVLVLGNIDHQSSPRAAAEELAERLIAMPNSRWTGKTLVGQTVGARRSVEEPSVYPMGAPRLLHLLNDAET